LPYLTKNESIELIKFRLRVAGGEDNIFTDAAYDEIFKQTQGIPREINRACSIALEYAFAEKLNVISVNVMKMVFDDIKEASQPQL